MVASRITTTLRSSVRFARLFIAKIATALTESSTRPCRHSIAIPTSISDQAIVSIAAAKRPLSKDAITLKTVLSMAFASELAFFDPDPFS